MITLVTLFFKLIKWTVLTVAYLLVGLAKLVTIIIVLIFFTARAGIRRLLDAKSGSDDETEEYDLGYPSYYGRSSERLTRDAFDARWQRERDLRGGRTAAVPVGGRPVPRLHSVLRGAPRRPALSTSRLFATGKAAGSGRPVQ